MASESLISVVDDDESVRESLKGLLMSLSFAVEAFPSAEDYLRSEILPKTGCLILDVRMPGMGGFELQEELMKRKSRVPIIFISANLDDDSRRRGLGNGAVDCLLKPFHEDALLKAIDSALAGKAVN